MPRRRRTDFSCPFASSHARPLDSVTGSGPNSWSMVCAPARFAEPVPGPMGGPCRALRPWPRWPGAARAALARIRRGRRPACRHPGCSDPCRARASAPRTARAPRASCSPCAPGSGGAAPPGPCSVRRRIRPVRRLRPAGPVPWRRAALLALAALAARPRLACPAGPVSLRAPADSARRGSRRMPHGRRRGEPAPGAVVAVAAAPPASPGLPPPMPCGRAAARAALHLGRHGLVQRRERVGVRPEPQGGVRHAERRRFSGRSRW